MSGSKQITAIKGMNDILPPASARWEWLEDVVRRVMAQHAYRNVRTPIMELTQLYTRGLGEVTDIVEKEMYAFEDRADQHGRADHLALRPEGTAGLVRAVAEHNLLYDGGKRLFYMGPMFRRERPQRGRYRQFHQIGAEALGFGGPEVDAELILLAVALWRELGLTGWRLELNSLGQPDQRREHHGQRQCEDEPDAGRHRARSDRRYREHERTDAQERPQPGRQPTEEFTVGELEHRASPTRLSSRATGSGGRVRWCSPSARAAGTDRPSPAPLP